MNKFAKYVPEEDKKKQREHIGAVGMIDLFVTDEDRTVVFKVDEARAVFFELDDDPFGHHYSVQELDEFDPEIIAGESYDVIIDDTRYENLTAYELHSEEASAIFIGAIFDPNTGAINWVAPFVFQKTVYNEDGYREISMAIKDLTGTASDQSVKNFSIVIEHVSSANKLINPKYLPENIGGSGGGLLVVCDIYGETYYANMTYSEARAALLNGASLVYAERYAEQYCFYYNTSATFYDDNFGITCIKPGEEIYTSLTFYSDGTIGVMKDE